MIPSEMFYKSSGIGQTVPVVEEILLPNTVTRIGEAAFKNCANLKEIRLPESLIPDRMVVGQYASGSPKYGYPIGAGCFQGCSALTTIYIPGPINTVNGRKVVCHFNPQNTTMDLSQSEAYNLGHKVGDRYDASQTTIVVPEEYLSVYRTPYAAYDYGNPWKALGYNILSENPVYELYFDATRIELTDENFDITRAASFLGADVTLNSIAVEGKLKLKNPEIACRVFDNDKPVELAADGTISVEFLNPAKNETGAGHHTITVVNTHNLAFNATSALFSISDTEVTNAAGHNFEVFDTADSIAPVLRDIAENSTVRFRVHFESEHADALEARVMSGVQELTPDADGFYTLEITNAGKSIEIFAVPGNGASLNEAEIAALDPAQSAGVTSVALTGEMSAETMAHALECFPALESLDLSDYEGELPDATFAGMTSLTTVALPAVEAIGHDMFSGCSSLQSVDIPASVIEIGEGAFRNCTSLENIKLTGIHSVGAGAFSGCDNLTTITLLADNNEQAAPAAAPRRSRAAGIDERAFEGLNPNCLVVADQGVVAPTSGVNFIVTSVGTVTETLPDGTTAEREGRIYTATAPVVFLQGYPLAIPHAFSLAEGTTITLEAENEKWGALVVPFEPETITDGAGKTLEITLVKDDAEKAYGNLLYTLAEGDDALRSTAVVAANTPYLFHTPELTKVVFSASKGKVPATPAEVRVDGKDFSLHATYTSTTLPAATTYLLADDATTFKPTGSDYETIGLAPFELYATSPAAVADIATGLPEIDITVGVNNVVAEVSDLRVAREGGKLVIYSPDSRTETVYAIDGRAIATIALKAGRNEVDLNLTGLYILANTKLRF